MNERIRELYEQALEQHVSNNSAWEDLNPEKFAELIVQECAELFPLTSRPLSGGSIQYTIKQHFGVDV
jgi:hypothetical protein